MANPCVLNGTKEPLTPRVTSVCSTLLQERENSLMVVVARFVALMAASVSGAVVSTSVSTGVVSGYVRGGGSSHGNGSVVTSWRGG